MKIKKRLFFFKNPVSTTELGDLCFTSNSRKEWLDVAKHIWAHLDRIAHGERKRARERKRDPEFPGDWLSVSQAVAMFGTLCLRRCLIMLCV